ncbi:methyl-accepting chemotaxis protein [Anaerosacchariphilus polymeriproducens]|uniref:Methyl-accepting chemotaxis protein n=2 Tax=Anaerosacchariphilus polymeriproducens TaxID=1812858 RepID=A0A371AV20_9FIRM|nr:methyl-accepting chemotaxis protein [Anaerosacchariphilus polymeriproducens]
MKSIRTKLIISFIGVSLLVSMVLGYIALTSSIQVIRKQAENSLLELVYEEAKLIVSRMEIQKRTLEMLAMNDTIQSMDWNVQQKVIKSQLDKMEFLDIAIVQTDGKATYSDGSKSELGDREYLQKALNGEANISDVLISKVTNEPVIMIAVPIYKNNKVVGALVGRRDGNALCEIVDSSGFGKEGYGYIINSKGTIIAHPDREKVLNQFNPIEEVKKDNSLLSVSKLFEKILKEKNGISTYNYNGESLYAGYEPIEGTEWYFIITASKTEVLASLPVLQNKIFLSAVIIMALSIGLAYLIGTTIAKPIIKTVHHSKKIADLDISVNLEQKYVDRKDEIGALSKALQSITDSIREIVGDISNSSESLAAASEELTATSQQSASTSEEISYTITELSKGASDQAQNTEEGSSKADLLGEVIEKDQKHLSELNAATEKVEVVLKQGLIEIEHLSKKTEENNKASKEIHEVIVKTNESSTKIGEASSVISSIAEQTNLLSLNAAIEAARAGEAGRGFAIVAEEIRKLAEQSEASTKNIDQMVQELQENSQEAVATIIKMSKVIKEQTDSVINSKNNFLLIREAILESSKIVGQLNDSGQEMSTMKNEIQDTLQNLSAIAEEYSAATQQVTSTMEEQTESAESIAKSSEDLAKLAQNLQVLINKFQTI